jgi:hypothetical protein
MAILTESSSSSAVRCLFNKLPSEGLAPKGTYRARLIDIVDKFKVERRKYDNPNETEIVDLTQFRFGFRDRSGTPWTVDTRSMKISGNEKSSLFALLKSITGEAPKMGWDYQAIKGVNVLITIEHKQGKVAQFATIATVSPLPEGFGENTAPAQPVAPPPMQPVPPPQPAPATPPSVAAAPSVEDAGDDQLPF